MNPRLKKAGYSAAAVLGLFAGGAGIASAVSTTTSAPIATIAPAAPAPAADTNAADPAGNEGNEADEPNGGNDQQDADETAISGSVTAPAESTGTEDHAAEDAALAKLATITPDQASAAALVAVPGTVGDVKLKDEDGFVVYSVDVTTATGDVEVVVDAGNGAILGQEAGGEHGDGDHGGRSNTDPAHEANETPERAAAEAAQDAAAPADSTTPTAP